MHRQLSLNQAARRQFAARFCRKNRFRVIAMHYRGVLALFRRQDYLLRRVRFAPHRV